MNRGSEWRKWDLHVHTASSYDHEYKASNSNELLVKAWRDNNIAAVAITDHFLIDANRIKDLKTMAPEITIFPGVELRCDKGASNLHVIIIFPDENIDNLENRFNVIMRDTKAKHKDNAHKIYWDFNEIVDFAKDHKGIISVHAGKKDKGIDKAISNSLEVNEAIKEEIASFTHIFEMGKIQDFETYDKHVFNSIPRKAMIICSDNHDPRKYELNQNLWIKSDCTFEGLLQAIKEPELRVYVGRTPPKVDVVNINSEKFIDSISIKGVNPEDTWFSDEIMLNYDLVTIIGNKGNGKSALADIIGHAGNTHNNRFSFLGPDRFNQKEDCLGKKYNVKIKWKNGIEEEKVLYPPFNDSLIEKVKYLPQQYIENVCNDLKDGFKEEIERLIFDYLPTEEKMGKKSLADLMSYLTNTISLEINSNQNELKRVNSEILDKEKMISKTSKESVIATINEYEKLLVQENENIPKSVEKPSTNVEEDKKLAELNSKVENLNKQIELKNKDLQDLTKKNYIIEDVISRIEQTKANYDNWIKEINLYLKNNFIDNTIIAKWDINHKELTNTLENNKAKISIMKLEVSVLDVDGTDGSLILELKNVQQQIGKITSKLSQSELNYQNYVQELNKWREKIRVIANKLSNAKEELRKLNEDVPKELDKLYEDRKNLCMKIYTNKNEIVKKYEQKYSYINSEINKLNMKKNEKPSIETNLYLDAQVMQKNLFDCISLNAKSIFRGKEQAKETLNTFIEDVKINDFESIFNTLSNIESEFKKSALDYEKVFLDKIGFFNNLYGLDYIKFNYELKLGKKFLKQLSPGERGLLLLIFYLILDKDNSPLIIDQPEDNLDNQSVFDRLVPYIIKAKNKRQIIIVTHNPNIAVACDSEQIIYSSMDKEKLQIKYFCGSMEAPHIKDHIVNVLEGTMPAFSKRESKYRNLE